jgi:hypothetical protein
MGSELPALNRPEGCQEVCMMRVTILALFLLLCFGSATAQNKRTMDSLSEEQKSQLEIALNKEDWVKSADMAEKFLKELKNGEEREVGLLRYIFIFACAGKVTIGKMSFEDLERALKDLVGKSVYLPPLALTSNCLGGMNALCFDKGESDRLFTTATNNTGTSIHAFGHIQLEKKIDLTGREGMSVFVGGVIKAIAPNPNKSRAIVMRLYIEKGYIEFPDR